MITDGSRVSKPYDLSRIAGSLELCWGLLLPTVLKPGDPSKAMKDYQRRFIDLAISQHALLFGEYTLKSGRVSPYFFNAGRFCDGASLAVLGDCYAAAIIESGLAFDVLFGPAYKGIPLATTTAVALARNFDRPTPYCFNRKEAKRHGEGGNLVGAELSGRALIIDDVMTAGTAIREVMDIFSPYPVETAGVILGLDRRERGQGVSSAAQEVEKEFSVPVTSIIDIGHIIEYLETGAGAAVSGPSTLDAVRRYRDRYGV